MKVLIFGASGRTGRELVKQGLAQDLALTAFVRNPAKFEIKHANLRIHQGDVADRRSVESAITDQDAAISALGGATVLKRDPALIIGMHTIVTAMEQAGVRRLVYLSADTVHAVRDQLNVLRKYIIIPLIFGKTAADHEVNEGIISQSHLDWTIVRPPVMTNGARTGAYRCGEHLKARAIIPQISRADVADFMLKQLTADTFLHKAPLVMY